MKYTIEIVEPVADRLRKILHIRNIRQRDFAKMVNLTEGTLSNYLSGRYEPKPARIEEMAKALQVSPGWLAGYDVPMNEKTAPTDVEAISTVKLRLVEKINAMTNEEANALLLLIDKKS